MKKSVLVLFLALVLVFMIFCMQIAGASQPRNDPDALLGLWKGSEAGITAITFYNNGTFIEKRDYLEYTGDYTVEQADSRLTLNRNNNEGDPSRVYSYVISDKTLYLSSLDAKDPEMTLKKTR